jgi:arsenate reductase
MITVYGIKNCDTCRKALKWLAAEGIDHRFHDFRTDGLDRATLDRWTRTLNWEQLLNRRGTTWRNLPDDAKDSIDAAAAMTLMEANPTLIKRPVFDLGNEYAVGFKDAEIHAIRSRASNGG